MRRGAFEILDDFGDARCLDDAYAALETLFLPANFLWVPAGARPSVEVLAEYVPSAVARLLNAHLASIAEVIHLDGIAGFEVWHNLVGRSEDDVTSIHVDCDEQRRKDSGEIVTPVWSTILHVGPRDRIEGGETAIDLSGRDAMRAHCFKPLSAQELRRLSHDWVYVPQRFNRFVCFEGSAVHGVMPVRALPGDGKARITVLVNLWDQTPAIFRGIEGYSWLEAREASLLARLSRRDIELLASLFLSIPDAVFRAYATDGAVALGSRVSQARLRAAERAADLFDDEELLALRQAFRKFLRAAT